jgi:hypothetical protein
VDQLYEADFDAEGVRITMNAFNGGDSEWYFAFLMPTADQRPGYSGRTTSHARSATVAGISYLRIIRTVGEAILDFCARIAPEAINVSGADGDDAKAEQKTRLYLTFLRDNASRIAQAGYTVMHRGDGLWLVRKSRADATGVK